MPGTPSGFFRREDGEPRRQAEFALVPQRPRPQKPHRGPFRKTPGAGGLEQAPSSGTTAKEAAQPTQEAAGPGEHDAAGDRLEEVLGPQAPRPVADPDLPGPLGGLHGDCPGPP